MSDPILDEATRDALDALSPPDGPAPGMKYVCTACRVDWKRGMKHKFPCANARYGWAFVDEVPIKRPKKETTAPA